MRTAFLTIFMSLMTLCCLSAPARALIASHAHNIPVENSDEFHLFLGVSSSLENGDMTYTIQGPEDGGWKSTLKWPLENILYIGGITSFSFGSRVQAQAGIWKSVTDDSGTMKDSDWLYGYYGNERAIYSESDTTVDSTQFDMNVRYDIWQRERTSLGLMLGYALTRWEWEASDGYQWTIDTSRFFQGSISGLGIRYTQEITVPYVGAAFSFSAFEHILLGSVYALYSPLAACDDEDDHVKRFKLSTGDTDGNFFSLGGNVRWNMTDQWSVSSQFFYTSYNLDGEQRQYFYAGENAGRGASGIDLAIEGTQTYLGVMAGYQF